MKQETTAEDWKQLTQDQREKLLTWYAKSGRISDGLGIWVPLSIGQMIEFLGRDYPEALIMDYYDGESNPNYYQPEELCDALWEAVKQTLTSP